MQMHRASWVLATALVAALGCKKGDAPHEATPAADTLAASDVASAKVLAIKFHSDTCGSCRALIPVVADCRKDYADKGVVFAMFDFTNDTTTARAKAGADTLGLAALYAEKAPKTGFVVLVDPNTKQVLRTLTKKESVEQWHAALEEALGNRG